MLTELKNILGITGSDYDALLILIASWIIIYFLYLLVNVLSSAVNRV